MKVPQLSPDIGKEEYAAISDCFENNWITEGPKAKEFVEKILELTGSKYGVLAPNGTLAIYLGLRALGIGFGDEVIVPDFTFMGSATAVEMTGATPVFVDVNRKNFQIDVSKIGSRLTRKTKAIIPVHIYGTIANMEEIMAFSKKHGLKVIEDAAEAIGVLKDGKHAGTFGDLGCFSFFADKTITTAEGGMIVTNNKKLYENLLYLRNQGRINRGSFVHPKIGYNFRMTDLQCAVGVVQLKKLKNIIEKKQNNLNLYKKLLSNIPEINFFEPDRGTYNVPFRVGILYEYAQELMEYLARNDIEPRTFFYPLHKQPCFKHLVKKYGYKDKEFENSIYGFEKGICLPVFPSLKGEQIKYVCRKIREFVEMKRRIFYKYYDDIYKEKDYSGEVTSILGIVSKELGRMPSKILEIGCGTGNHTAEFVKKGLKVTAIDIDKEMIAQALDKLKKMQRNKAKIYNLPLEKLGEEKYEISCALFNVISYIDDYNQLQGFFEQVSKRLTPGGLFLFDFWNGIAVVKDPPKGKVTHTVSNSKRIKVKLTPEVNLLKQKVLLNYEIDVASKGKLIESGKLVIKHSLWTPAEITAVAKRAGFKTVGFSPLFNIEVAADENTWKIMGLIKK